MNEEEMKIGLFVPCCMDQFMATTGLKVYAFLQRIGHTAYVPSEATCCGKILYNSGDREGAKHLGERLIQQYADCTHIVVCSSSCASYIKSRFETIFLNTAFHNEYRSFINRCYELCDFMVNELHYKPTGVRYEGRVAYMEHCGTRIDYISRNNQEIRGVSPYAKELLHDIEGLEMVEIEHSDVCCGYGGVFANQYIGISDSLAKRKIDTITEAGADTVVSADAACLLHLRSYIEKHGLKLKCAYIGDIVCS